MIRGICFCVPNGCPKLFEKILHDIDIIKYTWENIENDNQVYRLNKNNDFLFTKPFYTGYEFKKLISSNNYYSIFVHLHAYFTNELQKIDSYYDFLNRKCQMIILLTDSIFVEVYCKDVTIIQTLKQNAKKNSFKDIRYITDKNDTRDKFCAI